ncbi:MAG: HNH endonuclease [Candidatus Eremiobacteraeota bacterium]|nr:HNH endonuclease [Candidatus Eremiobacteraeota bacterium]
MNRSAGAHHGEVTHREAETATQDAQAVRTVQAGQSVLADQVALAGQASEGLRAGAASPEVIREYPGYEAVMAGEQVFQIAPGLPLVTYGADEVLSRDDGRNIFRDLACEVLDWNLWCLSSAGVKLDLLIGEMLLSLNGKLEKLGYVRVSDFAREVLGISSRSAYELMKNAQELQKFPLMRDALEKGLLRKSALRYLFQVVKPETEEEWLSKVISLSVRGLEEEVRRFKIQGSEGKEDIVSFASGEDDEEDKAIPVSARVPLAVAAKWDRALEVFRRMEESNLLLGAFVEALLAEYSASAVSEAVRKVCGTAGEACEKGFGSCSQECGSGGKEHNVCCTQEHGLSCEAVLEGNALLNGDSHSLGTQPSAAEAPLFLHGSSPRVPHGAGLLLNPGALERDRELARQVHKDLEEVSHFWDYLPWKPVKVELPSKHQAQSDTAVEVPSDPFEAVSRLRKIVSLRHSISFYQGRLLRTLNNFGLYKDMLFLSLGHYTRERLGMSRSTAYSLISLERSYLEYPDMLDLVKEGRLTPEQARLLSRVFREGTRAKGAWLSYAQEVPVATLREVVDAFLRFAQRAANKKWDIEPGALEVAVTGRSVKRVSPAGSNATEPSGDVGSDAPVRSCAQALSREGATLPRGALIWEVTRGGEHPEIPEILSTLSGETSKKGAFGSNPESRGALIRFFLAPDLVPLWNHAVKLWQAERAQKAAEASSDKAKGAQGSQAVEELPLFIEALLDSFLATWETPEKRDLHSRILRRDNYQCQVPGCTCRRGLHVHHIVYRSHGGSDIEANLITICMAHHLRCVHEGFLIIKGKAPHALTFILRAS